MVETHTRTASLGEIPASPFGTHFREAQRTLRTADLPAAREVVSDANKANARRYAEGRPLVSVAGERAAVEDLEGAALALDLLAIEADISQLDVEIATAEATLPALQERIARAQADIENASRAYDAIPIPPPGPGVMPIMWPEFIGQLVYKEKIAYNEYDLAKAALERLEAQRDAARKVLLG